MTDAVVNDADELTLDAGPLTGRAGSERTCIVNRRAGSPDHLIRFVLGPDGAVVPDLKARLPGRGAWVTATREAVTAAVKRKLFSRAFRREVAAPADLPDMVERLLEAQALAALSLANKAGAVVAGFAKVQSALAEGKVAGLIQASDARADGIRKIGQAERRARAFFDDEIDDDEIRDGETRDGNTHADTDATLPRVAGFTSLQLDLALGRMNVVHAALLAGGPSSNLLARCMALEVYRTGSVTGETPPAPANGPKH